MTKFKKILSKTLFFLPLLLFGLTSAALATNDVNSLPVNLGVVGVTNILYVVAFVGGMLMILTPCSAATIPAYFAAAFGDKSDGGSKSKITQRTAIFFLGFATVYAFMGGGASLIGRWLNIYQEQLSIIAGILLLIFGLLILIGKSFFSFSISSKTKPEKSARGTFTFGTLFAVGFSGCAGPILAGILTIAAGLPTTQAVLLMFFYSLGMGVPLLLLSLLFDKYKILNTKFFRWSKKIKVMGKDIYLTLPNLISGLLLLALGTVFIVFRSTSTLSATFPRAITDIGYGMQDWLLAINIPPYVDTLALILAGYLVIKLLAKLFLDPQTGEWHFNINIDKIKYIFIAIALILFGFNQLLFFNKQSELKQKLAAATEASRPAKLELTIINNNDCPDCFDIAGLAESLQAQNVEITSSETIDWQSEQAQALINQLEIKKIPNLVIKGELDKDSTVKQLLAQAGTIKNGIFSITDVPPPYMVIESGEIKGLFKSIYLVDKSCSECYDPATHKVALRNLGMFIGKENLVDITSDEGKELIRKYKITAVPTIILSGSMDEYPAVQQIWPKIGTVENDGSYVFRELKLMGNYKDLITGEIITKEQTQ